MGKDGLQRIKRAMTVCGCTMGFSSLFQACEQILLLIVSSVRSNCVEIDLFPGLDVLWAGMPVCEIEGDGLGHQEMGVTHTVCRKAEDTTCVLTKGRRLGCNFKKYDKEVN